MGYGTQASQIGGTMDVHGEYLMVVAADSVVAETQLEIEQARKRCLDDCIPHLRDNHGFPYLGDVDTAVVQDQIDDDQGPVEADVGRGSRYTAKIQGATMTLLCLDVEVNGITLSRLATYRGCFLVSPDLRISFASGSNSI